MVLAVVAVGCRGQGKMLFSVEIIVMILMTDGIGINRFGPFLMGFCSG